MRLNNFVGMSQVLQVRGFTPRIPMRIVTSNLVIKRCAITLKYSRGNTPRKKRRVITKLFNANVHVFKAYVNKIAEMLKANKKHFFVNKPREAK